MKKTLYFVLISIGLGHAGCGPLKLEAGAEPKTYSMDGVKLISTKINNGRDSSTYTQGAYTVAPDRHLLLRFESFSSHVSQVSLANGNKVQVQITLVPTVLAANAQAALLLCPLTSNWMMLATWNNPYPDGQWSNPGGDYDQSACVKADAPASADSKILLFNMTQWFKDYPQGRGINNGLILISSAEISIVGDTSGSNSPRILWQE